MAPEPIWGRTAARRRRARLPNKSTTARQRSRPRSKRTVLRKRRPRSRKRPRLICCAAPFVLKPGKNEVRIAVSDLKNTNGTPAKLSEVRRWYVGSQTPVTLLVGDIFLEGKEAKDIVGAKETGPAEKASKTYLLRGTA